MLISAITQSGAAGRQIGLASAFNKERFGFLCPVGRSRTVNSRVQQSCASKLLMNPSNNIYWLIFGVYRVKVLIVRLLKNLMSDPYFSMSEDNFIGRNDYTIALSPNSLGKGLIQSGSSWAGLLTCKLTG